MKTVTKKNWPIILACGLSVGYTIVLGRFLRVEYLKIFIIFSIYFLSGFMFNDYYKFISWGTLLFFLPGIFFISYGFYDNVAASITWTVELIIILIGFISGYYTRLLPKLKKIILLLSSILFIVGFSLIVNPRIIIASQFKEFNSNERIQNNQVVNFSLLKPDGSYITSYDLKGKIILLDFWFIGCAPCYDKMEYLGKVSEHYYSRNDVVVITVDVEQGNKFEDFQRTYKRFPTNIIYTYDSAGILAKELKLKGFPTEIILDKSGKIRNQSVGFNKDVALIYTNNTIDKIDKVSTSN